ncbi:hypothetical protein ACTXT7_000566 [Hymenolepis weldensis]
MTPRGTKNGRFGGLVKAIIIIACYNLHYKTRWNEVKISSQQLSFGLAFPVWVERARAGEFMWKHVNPVSTSNGRRFKAEIVDSEDTHIDVNFLNITD